MYTIQTSYSLQVQIVSDYIKNAVIGTEAYHETMRQIATDGLQRMAGYKVQSLDSLCCYIPPVDSDYLDRVDTIMQTLADDVSLTDCNPRSPFLMLAWLLIGSDNPYASCQYVYDAKLHTRIAIILIRIALGDTPVQSYIQAIKIATVKAAGKAAVTWGARASWMASWAARAAARVWIVETAAGIVETIADAVSEATVDAEAKDSALITIASRAKQWSHITDTHVMQIVQQLLFDILNINEQ